MSTVYFGTKTTLVMYEFFAVKEALIERRSLLKEAVSQ
jgi:hypothetical protein